MRSSPAGITTVFANLPAMITGQPLGDVNGLAVGPDGSLYYTESRAIRRITPRGAVRTVVKVPVPAGAPSIPGTAQHPYLREFAVAREESFMSPTMEMGAS